ncbi:MAG: hypothetical protein COA62_02735 [Rhodobiaceae bacterium]|nr:MAG: hypothetical protein COA62_02735 [Rhodobiaceae bacterium]
MSDISEINFCDYELSDYDFLKPIVERLLLEDPTTVRTQELLKTIHGFEAGNTQPLPKIENGRFVDESGNPIVQGDQIFLSGETLFGGVVVCEKEFRNQNRWHFILHEGVDGGIMDVDFFVLIKDENFAKRGVPLRVQYLSNRKELAKTIHSIIRELDLDIGDLVELMLTDGLHVRKSVDERTGNSRYYFTGENTRHWHRVLPAPGGNGGIVTTSIRVDADGEYIDQF